MFFSRQHRYSDEETSRFIDEQLMTASTPVEWNRICVVFSPNEFNIASDSKGGTVSGREQGLSILQAERARQLPKNRFREWLGKSRTRDPKMSYTPIDIIIHQVKKE